MTDDIDIAQSDGCNCVEGEEEAVDEGPETVLLSSEKEEIPPNGTLFKGVEEQTPDTTIADDQGEIRGYRQLETVVVLVRRLLIRVSPLFSLF